MAQVLAEALAGIAGLRVEPYVSDKSRPPVCIIGQPSIDWTDPESGFCWATWDFPLLLVTARNQDRSAQSELSRLVRDVANALNDFPTGGTGVSFIAAQCREPDHRHHQRAGAARLQPARAGARVATRRNEWQRC